MLPFGPFLSAFFLYVGGRAYDFHVVSFVYIRLGNSMPCSGVLLWVARVWPYPPFRHCQSLYATHGRTGGVTDPCLRWLPTTVTATAKSF